MQTVGLQYPHRIHLSVPHMGGGEEELIHHAFQSNWLSTCGPNLDALEHEFSDLTGLPSLAVVNGTAALHLGLKLLGVQPGDEVVVPTLTFVASVNPVLYQKAVPVFLDSESSSWNMDPTLLADFLEKRASKGRLPKAVMVVHLYGQCADLDPVLETCRRYEVPLLEDAAEALGATYKGRPAGTVGNVGAFSFNGNKIVTATSGGMLVSGDRSHLEQARHWSTQSRDPDPGRNYVHSEVGYNYRLSNVLAGIARAQLKLLPERIEQRRAVAQRYQQAFADLPGIERMPEPTYGRSTNWLSCFLVEPSQFGASAAEIIARLEAANVDSRPVWRPMHTQPLFRECEILGGEVAEDLNRRGLCLPSSSNLTAEEQEFVVRVVRGCQKRLRT